MPLEKTQSNALEPRGYVEQYLFRSYTGPIPHLFLCGIDDCIGAASCSHEELEQFINFINIFHSNLILLYIGEIKWRLGDRFVERLCSVHNKRQHLPVVTHFDSPSHSLGDVSVLALLQCHNDTSWKLEEQHLIFRLGSLQPNGLNVDFTSFKISLTPA
eukprot:g48413.t1